MFQNKKNETIKTFALNLQAKKYMFEMPMLAGIWRGARFVRKNS